MGLVSFLVPDFPASHFKAEQTSNVEIALPDLANHPTVGNGQAILEAQPWRSTGPDYWIEPAPEKTVGVKIPLKQWALGEVSFAQQVMFTNKWGLDCKSQAPP
jgi:hypothetical protein